MGFNLKYGKPEGFVLTEDTVFLLKSLSCHEAESESVSLEFVQI